MLKCTSQHTIQNFTFGGSLSGGRRQHASYPTVLCPLHPTKLQVLWLGIKFEPLGHLVVVKHRSINLSIVHTVHCTLPVQLQEAFFGFEFCSFAQKIILKIDHLSKQILSLFINYMKNWSFMAFTPFLHQTQAERGGTFNFVLKDEYQETITKFCSIGILANQLIYLRIYLEWVYFCRNVE